MDPGGGFTPDLLFREGIRETLEKGRLVEARTGVRAAFSFPRRGLGGCFPQVEHSARRFGSSEPICAEGARRGESVSPFRTTHLRIGLLHAYRAKRGALCPAPPCRFSPGEGRELRADARRGDWRRRSLRSRVILGARAADRFPNE